MSFASEETREGPEEGKVVAMAGGDVASAAEAAARVEKVPCHGRGVGRRGPR